MVTALLNCSVPALIGAVLFSAFIGVFGLERAIGGLLAAVLLKLAMSLSQSWHIPNPL